MTPKWDYIAKIVSLGDSGCGKSSLTVRLCEGRFVPQHDVTIGVEFGSRIMPVGPPASLALGINDPAQQPATASPAAPTPADTPDASSQKHCKISIWDTAGQETYKAITRSYFRGAAGALLVFDITRRSTFDSVTSWLADLRALADDGIVVVLVGNKADLAPDSTVQRGSGSGRELENRRRVTRAEAEAWAAANGVMRYVETSAKSGEGVERAFLEVAERIFQNIEAGRYDLNDRRSGVKSAAAGGGGASNSARTVNLAGTDGGAGGRGWTGGCC